MTKELIQVEITTISVQHLEALLDAKVKLILEAISQANSKSNSDEWFDINGLIAYLPSHPKSQTIYEWVHKGIIPFHKAPETKGLSFLKSEIDVFIKSGRKKTQLEKDEIVNKYLTKINKHDSKNM
jgi:hypothetical protein